MCFLSLVSNPIATGRERKRKKASSSAEIPVKRLLRARSGGAVFGILVTKSISYVRKLIVLVIGSTVVLVGIVMIVTPGPAFLVISAGLGILALEFVWARTLLKRAKAYIASQADKVKAKLSGPFGPPPEP